TALREAASAPRFAPAKAPSLAIAPEQADVTAASTLAAMPTTARGLTVPPRAPSRHAQRLATAAVVFVLGAGAAFMLLRRRGSEQTTVATRPTAPVESATPSPEPAVVAVPVNAPVNASAPQPSPSVSSGPAARAPTVTTRPAATPRPSATSSPNLY